MQRSVLLNLSQKELHTNFLRFQQSIEELEFCLVSVLEEQDELLSTNQMYKEVANNLKPTGQGQRISHGRVKSEQWSEAMQDILNEKPSDLLIEKTEVAIIHKHPCNKEAVEEEKAVEQAEDNSSDRLTERSYDEETKASDCSEHIDLPKHYANKSSSKSITKPPWRMINEVKKPSRMRRLRAHIYK